jgi:hypothetical protein
MKIIDNAWLCELDSCIYPDYVRKYFNCKECKHCIDGIYYAEKEAEEMLKEEPYYLGS